MEEKKEEEEVKRKRPRPWCLCSEDVAKRVKKAVEQLVADAERTSSAIVECQHSALEVLNEQHRVLRERMNAALDARLLALRADTMLNAESALSALERRNVRVETAQSVSLDADRVVKMVEVDLRNLWRVIPGMTVDKMPDLVLDTVMAQLRDDEKALRACLATCLRFNHAARDVLCKKYAFDEDMIVKDVPKELAGVPWRMMFTTRRFWSSEKIDFVVYMLIEKGEIGVYLKPLYFGRRRVMRGMLLRCGNSMVLNTAGWLTKIGENGKREGRGIVDDIAAFGEVDGDGTGRFHVHVEEENTVMPVKQEF